MMREKEERQRERSKEKAKTDGVVALNGGAFGRGTTRRRVVLLAVEALQFTTIYLIGPSKSARLMRRDEKASASRRPRCVVL